MLHNNTELFEQAVLRTSEHMGIDAGIIEKDYFVTLMLQEISSRVPDIVFKGGTSLSKCHKIINRFSEDIDLTVSYDEKPSEGKIRVTEDFEGSVLNIIQAWCDLIHANIAGTRLPSILYSTIASIELGGHVIDPRTGKKLGKRTIWLKNVYPIGYQVGELDPSSSKAIDVSIDFNYDFFADNSYSLIPTVNNTLTKAANSAGSVIDKGLDWLPNFNNL